MSSWGRRNNSRKWRELSYREVVNSLLLCDSKRVCEFLHWRWMMVEVVVTVFGTFTEMHLERGNYSLEMLRSIRGFQSCICCRMQLMEELQSTKILTVPNRLSWKGDSIPTGWATGVGGVTVTSHVGSLATTILTRFPQFRNTWATCSLLIPCTFVPPISKMWSPVLSLPSFE